MASITAGSFRDPSGFIFSYQGKLYRQINHKAAADYELLFTSGLYEELTASAQLVSHQEVKLPGYKPKVSAYKVIQPQFIDFISYPYEWSFSMLKDAALLTLAIHKKALDKNLSLKDASAYNIQFVSGQPTLIDTLSFEKYTPGSPWVAYRQFCQHFLAPLALMAHTDVRLNELQRIYIDGIPLDLAAKLLPRKTKFSFGLYAHLHLHARAQNRYSEPGKAQAATKRQMSKQAQVALITSLENGIKKLNWKPANTQWADYYNMTNYQQRAFSAKKSIVIDMLKKSKPKVAWDLGANNGEFSRLVTNAQVMAFDIDPAAVEQNYLQLKKAGEKHILPLVMDLTNPSPALGWAERERDSLRQRGPADTVLALALIHHLAIANNVPLPNIAEYFAQLGRDLIIEFVPKVDSQTQKLLAAREDIFTDYTQDKFEQAFKVHYRLIEKRPVKGSKRTLYLFRLKNARSKKTKP